MWKERRYNIMIKHLMRKIFKDTDRWTSENVNKRLGMEVTR